MASTISQTKEISPRDAATRPQTQFIRPFGPGPDSLPVEAHRYRLLWSPVCPWAHRAVIVRELLGLQSVISLGTADPLRPKLDRPDWAFTLDPGHVDPVLQVHYISEVYANADPTYEGRPTVPAIVDIHTKSVVQNDYLRLTYYFEKEWQPFHRPGAPDLFPTDLQGEIEALNQAIFDDINNGVYQCGFAKSQEAYDEAFDHVFARLDELEARLATRRYLHGDRMTDSDVRLYVTFARFDIEYYGAFLVNQRRLIDYPNLWAYARDLYQTPGFGSTTDFVAIKKHFWGAGHIRPNGSVARILPRGPDLSLWDLPHGREGLSRSAK
jgi:putative glutathione S-transferase